MLLFDDDANAVPLTQYVLERDPLRVDVPPRSDAALEVEGVGVVLVAVPTEVDALTGDTISMVPW